MIRIAWHDLSCPNLPWIELHVVGTVQAANAWHGPTVPVFQSSVIWIWPFRELKMKPLVSWLNRGQKLPFHRVFKSTFVGRLSIVKERFSKKYRHPLLDSKLTVKRLNMEVRCMTKVRRLGVPTPVLYAVDPILHTLTFEYVDGLSVKEILLDFGLNGIVEEQLDDIAIQIGTAMGKMHDGGLIHGDLTTSNMIIRERLIIWFPNPKNKEEFAELQARLRKHFPIDMYNKARRELDPKRILSNALLGKIFPSTETSVSA
ncbi:hypothetical protein ZIOFF_043085 [Zingiber officinale]|uniref:non-specific serine/threonine protein kinase n=1 Tax=Zingiber officinale TaxID=94328 RepID=A0A8J5FVX8_ZINOF|nr:hypothetical protein ZIOFF_043085 [Zingiber officinale]